MSETSLNKYSNKELFNLIENNTMLMIDPYLTYAFEIDYEHKEIYDYNNKIKDRINAIYIELENRNLN